MFDRIEEFPIKVDGRDITCTRHNTIALVFARNHLLDHLRIREMHYDNDGKECGGYRAYRELFERNEVDFDQLVVQMRMNGFTVASFSDEQPLPEEELDNYVLPKIGSVIAEAEYILKEAT